MTLLHQSFRIRNVHTIRVREHLHTASRADLRYHSLPMLQPTLNDHVLGTGFHPCHLKDLFGRVMHLLVLVKAAKAQPNDTAVLIQCEIATVNDSLKDRRLLTLQLNHLSAFQKGQLLTYFINSAMLIPCHALLVLEWVRLHLDLLVRDLMALSLLRVCLD